LKPWVDTYRSVGDVTDYTLPVLSGLHTQGLCQKKAAGCCIAQILLVPGQNLDVNVFVGGLYEASYDAKVLCKASVVQDLVKQLATDPDARIADRAREVLRLLADSRNNY